MSIERKIELIGGVTTGGTGGKSLYMISEKTQGAEHHYNNSSGGWYKVFVDTHENSVEIPNMTLKKVINGFPVNNQIGIQAHIDNIVKKMTSVDVTENRNITGWRYGNHPVHSWANLTRRSGKYLIYPSVAGRHFSSGPSFVDLKYSDGYNRTDNGANYQRVLNYTGNFTLPERNYLTVGMESGGSSYLQVNLFDSLISNTPTRSYTRFGKMRDTEALINQHSDDMVYGVNIFGTLTISDGYVLNGPSRAWHILNVMDGGVLRIIKGGYSSYNTRLSVNVFGSGKIYIDGKLVAGEEIEITPITTTTIKRYYPGLEGNDNFTYEEEVIDGKPTGKYLNYYEPEWRRVIISEEERTIETWDGYTSNGDSHKTIRVRFITSAEFEYINDVATGRERNRKVDTEDIRT